MRLRPPPEKPNLRPHDIVVVRHAVRDAAKRRLERKSFYRDPATPPERLTVNERVVVIGLVKKAKHSELDRISFTKQLGIETAALAQIISAPEVDDGADDLLDSWSAPEARELLTEWIDPFGRSSARGAVEFAKAVAITASGLGYTYVKSAYGRLVSDRQLQARFEQLAVETTGRQPVDAFRVVSYEQTTRLLRRLLPLVVVLAMRLNIAAARRVGAMLNADTVGSNVAIDSTYIDAWVAQVDAGTGENAEAREALLRSRVPGAGFRIRKRRKIGDPLPDGTQLVENESGRGFRLSAVTDMGTGIRLVAVLDDASDSSEASTAWRLLPMLVDLWPQVPARYLVGDAGFDQRDLHEYTARAFGIATVASRHDDNNRAGVLLEGKRFHKSIARITSRGEAYCRAHGERLLFRGAPFPSRHGLAPGLQQKSSAFRARFECPREKGCGRLNVGVDVSWSTLGTLPLNPVGRPDLYARRVALLAHRNTAENPWSSMRLGYGQGLMGAYRTHLLDRESVEGVLALTASTQALHKLRAARGG
jgi:hypothetical protein